MSDSFLKVETKNHEFNVSMCGSESDALINWTTLTHAVCTAYHIPPQVLAVALQRGILDEVGKCADSMTAMVVKNRGRGREAAK